MQEVEGLVDGGVCIKARGAGLELVLQDSIQALRQIMGLMLQLLILLLHVGRALLQLLIVPVITITFNNNNIYK